MRRGAALPPPCSRISSSKRWQTANLCPSPRPRASAWFVSTVNRVAVSMVAGPAATPRRRSSGKPSSPKANPDGQSAKRRSSRRNPPRDRTRRWNRAAGGAATATSSTIAAESSDGLPPALEPLWPGPIEFRSKNMRAEAQDHIDTINAALALLRRFLDWDRAVRRLDELNAKVEDPTLWDSPKAAQEVMRERRRLDEAINATRAIEKERDDTVELIELAEMEGDEALIDDAVASLAALAQRAEQDKIKALLAGEADGNDCYIEIHAGAGGTESQDWAEMLQRMY